MGHPLFLLNHELTWSYAGESQGNTLIVPPHTFSAPSDTLTVTLESNGNVVRMTEVTFPVLQTPQVCWCEIERTNHSTDVVMELTSQITVSTSPCGWESNLTFSFGITTAMPYFSIKKVHLSIPHQ